MKIRSTRLSDRERATASALVQVASSMSHRVCALILGILVVCAAHGAEAQSRSYTQDADFALGTLVNVNHDAVHDQLQLDESVVPLSLVWVATGGRRTIVGLDASTGEVRGEYRAAPQFRSSTPSRTAVDRFGNVWVGNRGESAAGMGSILKIGVVIGGTRGSKDADGHFMPDPTGAYLAPPFVYSTAIDRDGDGLIRTSSGIGDVLAWPAGSDGDGGETAEVEDALDECILLYQRTTATEIHHVSIGPDDRVRVGGFASGNTGFDEIDPNTGRIVTSFTPGCGGYGGIVDDRGIVWSASFNQNTLLRYDPSTGASDCVPVQKSAGVAVDAQGYVWNSMWDRNMIAKISPDGTVMPGFPKTTGGRSCFGVAATPDGHVWVANKGTHNVSRLDADGNVLAQIRTGLAPTGVAVDRTGRVWVTNQNDHNAVRIDPNGGTDGLGAVDLTVGLGSRASPLNYGGMTGGLDAHSLADQGAWTVVFDAERAGALWRTLTWDGDEPGTSTLRAHVRASEDASDLASKPWQVAENGVDFSDAGVTGRHIEIRVTLSADAVAGASPVLRSLVIEAADDSNGAPDCAQVTSSVDVVWPPNGRWVDVDILGLTDPDGDVVSCTITHITQDEPLSHDSDELEFASATGVGQSTARVRAARDGNGNGRVYEIHYRATDENGGECTGSVFVCVPHDMGQGRGRARGTCTDDGQAFDATAGVFADKQRLATANFPNPFNPSTTIHYTLFEETRVQLDIFDALGRHVRTLANQQRGAGSHRVTWDGRDTAGRSLASGVYIYRLRAGTSKVSKRMLLLK